MAALGAYALGRCTSLLSHRTLWLGTIRSLTPLSQVASELSSGHPLSTVTNEAHPPTIAQLVSMIERLRETRLRNDRLIMQQAATSIRKVYELFESDVNLAGVDVVSLLRAVNRSGRMEPGLLSAARPRVLASMNEFAIAHLADIAACYTYVPEDRGRHAVQRGTPQGQVLQVLAQRASSLLSASPRILPPHDVDQWSYLISALGRSGCALPSLIASACAKLTPSISAFPATSGGSFTAVRLAVGAVRQLPASTPEAQQLVASLRAYGIVLARDTNSLLDTLPAGFKLPVEAVYRVKNLLSITWVAALMEPWPRQAKLCTTTIKLLNRAFTLQADFDFGLQDAGRAAALLQGLSASSAQRQITIPPDCTPQEELRARIHAWRDNLRPGARPSALQSSVASALATVCSSPFPLPPPVQESTLCNGLLVDFSWSLPAQDARRAGVAGLVVEVAGPKHFLQQGAQLQLDAQTRFKYWVLTCHGYEVLHLGYQQLAGKGGVVLQQYLQQELSKTATVKSLRA